MLTALLVLLPGLVVGYLFSSVFAYQFWPGHGNKRLKFNWRQFGSPWGSDAYFNWLDEHQPEWWRA